MSNLRSLCHYSCKHRLGETPEEETTWSGILNRKDPLAQTFHWLQGPSAFDIPEDAAATGEPNRSSK